MADAQATAAESAQAAATVAEAVAQAHADHAAAQDYTRTCPKCGATQDITPAGLEGTTAADRNFCNHCSTEWFPATGKIYKAPASSAQRAASIAASWANPEVAAARAIRSSVTVSGGSLKGTVAYPSLRAAFVALGLPLGQHIKFRGQLKAEGVKKFINFKFVNLVS